MLKMGKGSLGLSPNGIYFKAKAKRTEQEEYSEGVIFPKEERGAAGRGDR